MMAWLSVAVILVAVIALTVSGFQPRPFNRGFSVRRSSRRGQIQASLIAGINKYSHDASVCILHEDTGEILFAQAKERLTGKKHDGGGATGEAYANRLVLRGATTVVNNNHHYRPTT